MKYNKFNNFQILKPKKRTRKKIQISSDGKANITI